MHQTICAFRWFMFFLFLFRTILVWCWLLSVLYFLKSSHLKFLIFQEQKIREGLYMMGLKDGIFHLSWFITYALQVNFVLFPWQNHYNCPFFIELSKDSRKKIFSSSFLFWNFFACYAIFANTLVMWWKTKHISYVALFGTLRLRFHPLETKKKI